MGLTNENVGPKILEKIKIYVLNRAELLFKVCYEIPCIRNWSGIFIIKYIHEINVNTIDENTSVKLWLDSLVLVDHIFASAI